MLAPFSALSNTSDFIRRQIMKPFVLKTALAAVAISLASAASAAPVCTTAPKAKWMSPAQMKARVAKMGYSKVKVFQQAGSCYEIYAQTKDGRRAEVYFNPVNGKIVQNNVD
jgi:hypothetical protein